MRAKGVGFVEKEKYRSKVMVAVIDEGLTLGTKVTEWDDDEMVGTRWCIRAVQSQIPMEKATSKSNYGSYPSQRNTGNRIDTFPHTTDRGPSSQ